MGEEHLQQAFASSGSTTAAKTEDIAPKKSNSERRKEKYARLIDAPELDTLTSLQKEFLRGRWLDQMGWFSDKADFYQNWFYWVRLTTIVCSVLAPVFIGFGSVWGDRLTTQLLANPPVLSSVNPNIPSPEASPTPPVSSSPTVSPTVPATTPSMSLLGDNPLYLSRFAFHFGLFLSQVVAILAAVEQFFKFGDRWRHYRRTAEVLKSHGWQFFQLGGVYSIYAGTGGGYPKAFPVFAAQVEEIVQSDVEGFVSQIATQKQIDKQENDPQAPN